MVDRPIPSLAMLHELHNVTVRIHALVGESRGLLFSERASAWRAPWPALDLPLLSKVMDHIDQHPREHDQTIWARTSEECGTSCCFAGHAVSISPQGYPMVWEPLIDGTGSLALEVLAPDGIKQRISDHAADLLGLTAREADQLFAGHNLRSQLRYMVQALELAETCRLRLQADRSEPVAPNEHNTECPHCYGTGKQGAEPCGPCGGKGWF